MQSIAGNLAENDPVYLSQSAARSGALVTHRVKRHGIGERDIPRLLPRYTPPRVPRPVTAWNSPHGQFLGPTQTDRLVTRHRHEVVFR